jgi:ribose/xylose/arabinose/galactoside ABC-type transport system permease subunit/ABC-type branched-subunit amino acid transport system ATPase component
VSPRNPTQGLVSRLLDFQELGIIIPLVAFSLFVGIREPVFFKSENLINIAGEVAFIGIIACVMTYVLVSGGIDLSVGSVLGLSGTLTALCLVNSIPVPIAVLIGFLTGTFCGLLNGLAVVFLRIPPVIVTLGTLYAARGVVLLVTEGRPLYPLPESFKNIGQRDIANLPLQVWILILIVILTHLVLTRTRYGLWIRAMGGNRESARLSGLPVRRLEVSVYVLSGMAAGLVGILLTAWLSAAYAQTGRTWELLVIASVIIGGTSLFGGIGTVIGSLVGATIIRVLSNALVILGVSAYWQEVCIGIIIIAAVAVDAHSRRLKKKHLARSARAGPGDRTGRKLDLKILLNQEEETTPVPASGESDTGPILELNGISKYFGHVRALEDVSLELKRGEVLALVGDNGAGKSTLIKIASGALNPDHGTIRVNGQQVDIQNPHDADKAGIATVYQDLALVDCLDVGANLFLGHEPSAGVMLRRGEMRRQTVRILEALCINLPSPRVAAGDLSGGQRQALAIARALLQGNRIVIMDEPTAALGIEEQARVLELIRQLREKGCSIIMISHNLNHVFNVADRIAVLRGGSRAGTFNRAETSAETVIAAITGADQLSTEMKAAR